MTSLPTISRTKCDNQLSLVPQTLNELYRTGITSDSKLKLEYFFYTSSEENARKLSKRLDSIKYFPKYSLSANDNNEFIITGWSSPVKMDEKSVKEWTLAMCYLGQSYNCDFDGWGTDPRQKK